MRQLDDKEEEARLSTLRRYAILDSPRDAAFDRIASMARRWFRAKAGVVTLVDRDRIWFKAVDGLDARQVAREPGLCSSVIAGKDEVYEVLDALADDRVTGNSLVTGPTNVRFYAAAPIVVGRHRLGTVCVLDSKARAALSEEERRTLQDLAAIAVDELELRLAIHERDSDLLGRGRRLRQAALSNAVHGIARTVAGQLQGVTARLADVGETLSSVDRASVRAVRDELASAAEGIQAQILRWGEVDPRDQTNVASRLSETLSLLEATAAGHGRSREIVSSGSVRLSPSDFDQVLMAVYGKAVELSPPGTTIHVSSEDAVRPGGGRARGVLVQVRHRRRLPLTDGPLSTVPSEANGDDIAMTVGASLVEGCGGQLTTESSEETSTWRLWLPAATIQRRVALVEDDQLVRSALVRGLTPTFEVEAFASPLEAVRALDPASLGALVADYNLPELTGLELARRLREEAPELPVMIITGYRLEGTLDEGMAFLRKPFSVKDLRVWLDGVLLNGSDETRAPG